MINTRRRTGGADIAGATPRRSKRREALADAKRRRRVACRAVDAGPPQNGIGVCEADAMITTAINAAAQFRESMVAAGLGPPDELIADGTIHRFSTNGTRRDDAGW
jgi:hypothetical protein